MDRPNKPLPRRDFLRRSAGLSLSALALAPSLDALGKTAEDATTMQRSPAELADPADLAELAPPAQPNEAY